MKMKIWKGILAASTLMLLVTGAQAASRLQMTAPSQNNPSNSSHPRPFKLKGAGAVDLTAGTFDFSGTATHLGKFTTTGAIDVELGNGSIVGDFTAANGDTLHWTAQFSVGPLGEFELAFTFAGGTGRFAGATGSASGPLALDPDLMFLLNLQGTISY